MAKQYNIIKEKSFQFAVRIFNLGKVLMSERKEYEVSKQLIRSGTSIGANVREAINAQSTADFIHKLSIAQKEADETIYWIELLLFTNTITEKEFNSINTDAVELLKIIKSIIITTKSKRDKPS
jgi:four helix bundle protein